MPTFISGIKLTNADNHDKSKIQFIYKNQIACIFVGADRNQSDIHSGICRKGYENLIHTR